MSAVLQESAPPIDVQDERVELAVTVTPEVRQVAAVSGALAIAQAYEVDCPEMAQALADERRLWAKRIDRMEAMKKDLIAPAKKALEDMRERLSRWFDPGLADLHAARDLAGVKLLAWETSEKERIAREKAEAEEKARKIRQEADAKAASELAKARELERQKEEQARVEAAARAKAEAEARAAAEAKRAAQEAGDKEAMKAAAEAERKANEEAGRRAAAEARAQEQAQAAAANGAARAQEAQTQAAAAASAVATVAEPVKIAGQSMKDNWVAELKPGLTAEQALAMICEAIVTKGRTDLLAILQIDLAARGALNKLAAAQKGLMTVPGFVAVNRPTLAGARK